MAVLLKESICLAGGLPADQRVIAGRAELLTPEDRELIEAVLMRGVSLIGVARITGESPGCIRRRFHRLVRRLGSKGFLNAARALSYLSEEDASLARMRFCRGASLRQMCRELGLTIYEVRRRVENVGAKIAMVHRVQQGADVSKAG